MSHDPRLQTAHIGSETVRPVGAIDVAEPAHKSPLVTRRTYSTTSVDEARAMLMSRESAGYTITPLDSANDFRLDVDAVGTPGLGVSRVRYGSPVMVVADEPLGSVYCATHAEAGGVRLLADRESIELSGTDSVVVDPDRAITSIREAATELVLVHVSRDTVREKLNDRGFSDVDITRFFMEAPPRNRDRKQWRSVVGLLEDSLATPTAITHDLWRKGLERFIVSTMFITHPNAMLAQSEQLATQSGSAQAARRTAEYLREHHHEPIRVAQLAADEHLSTRALQLAFRRMFGVTITEYLRELRLHSAHLQLRQDPSSNVSGIAYRWGFSSASRFAAHHLRYFGISPSDVTHHSRRLL